MKAGIAAVTVFAVLVSRRKRLHQRWIRPTGLSSLPLLILSAITRHATTTSLGPSRSLALEVGEGSGQSKFEKFSSAVASSACCRAGEELFSVGARFGIEAKWLAWYYSSTMYIEVLRTRRKDLCENIPSKEEEFSEIEGGWVS